MARATSRSSRKANAAATKADTGMATARPRSAPKAPRRAAAPPAVPKLSKDALRAQVEKLERANANLRVRNKELKRAADAAAGRLAELEAEVSRHERRAAQQAKSAVGRKPRRQPVRSRVHPDPDPEDMPPVVAVTDPESRSEAEPLSAVAPPLPG